MNNSALSSVKSVRVELPHGAGPVMQNLAGLLARQIGQRCDARVSFEGDAELVIELDTASGIGAEGFKIEDTANKSICISGNCERGVLYGIGKFLRTSRYDQGGFTPGSWRGKSIPAKPVRGIYFATHFHNFYHDAPVSEIKRYVEDLGLWGFNSLMVWYDMRHFHGFDDPNAVAFRERLGHILQAARDIGIGTAFLVIGNESDWTSPAACRANLDDQRGDESDDYICPSNPEGMEHLLKIMREEFEWFRQFQPEYLAINPYDPGGCGCEKCSPWVTNGFLKCSEDVARLAKAEMPGIKTILFTSLVMNRPGEWQSLAERLRTKPDWCDYVMTEKLTGDSIYGVGPVPRSHVGLPAIGFPDISMLNTSPWGGRGAATLPTYFESRWRERAPLLDGGFPYSEGIFEDMSKALFAQFYWQPDRSAEDILKEYVAFEFSPDVVDDVIPAIWIMEENNGRNSIRHGAATALGHVERAESKLTPQAAQAWRWRLVALRAKIDYDNFRSHAALKPAFDELRDIYHARNANGCVRPTEIIIADSPSFLPDQWIVLGPVDRSFTLTPEQLKTMPKSVESSGGTIALRKVTALRGQLDLATCLGGTAEYRTAYVFVPFELDREKEVFFGFGADWWFEAFVDGKPVCDSPHNGNGQFPPSAWDHMSAVQMKQGKHLLAIRFVSGNSSSFLCAGAF